MQTRPASSFLTGEKIAGQHDVGRNILRNHRQGSGGRNRDQVQFLAPCIYPWAGCVKRTRGLVGLMTHDDPKGKNESWEQALVWERESREEREQPGHEGTVMKSLLTLAPQISLIYPLPRPPFKKTSEHEQLNRIARSEGTCLVGKVIGCWSRRRRVGFRVVTCMVALRPAPSKISLERW